MQWNRTSKFFFKLFMILVTFAFVNYYIHVISYSDDDDNSNRVVRGEFPPGTVVTGTDEILVQLRMPSGYLPTRVTIKKIKNKYKIFQICL